MEIRLARMSKDAIIVIEKICTGCNKKKPIDEFYKKNSRLDGHTEKCIPCTKERQDARKAAKRSNIIETFIF